MTVRKLVVAASLVSFVVAAAVYALWGRGADPDSNIPALPPASSTSSTLPPSATAGDTVIPSTPQSAGAHEADAEVQQGIAVIFTWYPATDSTPNDAYRRARSWLTEGLVDRMTVEAQTERGPGLRWEEWARTGAKVVADVRIGCSGCPPDSDTVIHRVATIKQTAISADRTDPVDPDTTVWVTVVKKGDQWLIDDIRY